MSETTKRRHFLKRTLTALTATGTAMATGAQEPASWKSAGSGFSNYGQPHKQNKKIIRWITNNQAASGEGASWTPLHDLEGTITPNGLFFERHHNGVPSLDSESWSLTIHGKTRKALTFSLESLRRYPMISRIGFIECGGNSNSLWYPTPVQAAAGHLHGLVSCAEWTGVALSVLLDEAGLEADGKWLIADAWDASGVTVSLPLEKCAEDVIVALYQNGEPLRSENGFPARLFVPGWEGIVNVKWLRSLEVSDRPLWSKFDTVSYTDLKKNGIADRMTFEMGVKSVITSPSPGSDALQKGFQEIRGLAWSGAGKVEKVEVSVDGGQHWQQAQLQLPVLDKALTRFRIPWQWTGRSQVLMSRAVDSTGAVQPTRDSLIKENGENVYYHFNAIVGWELSASGELRHVYV